VAVSRFPESTTTLSPTHELAWSKPAEIKIPPQTFLNDISFTDYHVFRAEMRVLP
jgi:hypothetical protein